MNLQQPKTLDMLRSFNLSLLLPAAASAEQTRKKETQELFT